MSFLALLFWRLRILLDENVPALLAEELSGHEVRTVPRMRWAGIQNGELLQRAAGEFDVFITFDRSIEHQQVIPSNLSMLILHLPDNKPETVLAVTSDVLKTLEGLQPGSMTHIPGRG